MEYLFITSKTKLELLREQAEAATELKEKTDLTLQQKSSECVNLQNEINGLSDKISALEESNSQLESRKNELIAELDNNKKETTEIIVSKTAEMDELQLEINSLKELSSKHEEDHAEEVETLAMKITSLEEKLEDNLNASSSFEKAKQELESELATSKAQLQKFNEDNDLMVKQLDENDLKIKKLEENISSLQSTESLLITERSKMILELESYKNQQFVRPSTPVKSPQKSSVENSSVENALSKSEMEELGIAEESTEDIAPTNPDVVLSDGDDENVDNAISQYEVVSVGINTDHYDPNVSVDVVSIGVNTENHVQSESVPMESESPQMDICSDGLFTPPQNESQNVIPVQMVSIGIETDPVECASMAVNTSFGEAQETPAIVSSGVNTSIMTSPEKIPPMNSSFGVNTSFQVHVEQDESETTKRVEEMQEQIDASRTSESQLLSKLEDLTKQLEDSRALASSLEDKNQLLLGDNQTYLAAQLDFRSRVEELEVQIDQLKQSHKLNLDELQAEKDRLMKTLEEVENQLQNLKTKMAEDKSELEKVNLNIAQLQDQLSSTTNERDAVSLELNELKGNQSLLRYSNLFKIGYFTTLVIMLSLDLLASIVIVCFRKMFKDGQRSYGGQRSCE